MPCAPFSKSSLPLCAYPRPAALPRPIGGELFALGVLSSRLAAAKARPPSRRLAPLLTGGKLLTRGVLPSRPVALRRS